MAKIILVTGGGRSGKSMHAQRLAESLPGPRTYIATCPVVDEEMRRRILRHQKARDKARWSTVEETIDIASVIRGRKACPVLLLDCLTLWLSNLLYEDEKAGRPPLGEDDAARRTREVLDACREHPGTIIFVTNEVGMGIIPENELARRYRDLVGRCNQVIAAEANVVTLLVSGIPLHVKESS